MRQLGHLSIKIDHFRILHTRYVALLVFHTSYLVWRCYEEQTFPNTPKNIYTLSISEENGGILKRWYPGNYPRFKRGLGLKSTNTPPCRYAWRRIYTAQPPIWLRDAVRNNIMSRCQRDIPFLEYFSIVRYSLSVSRVSGSVVGLWSSYSREYILKDSFCRNDLLNQH